MKNIDPIKLEVIRYAFIAAAEEMRCVIFFARILYKHFKTSSKEKRI